MTAKTFPPTAAGTTVIMTMQQEALSALYDLRWMLAAVALLVIADFWFGITASLSRHEKFRFSRAGRRTFDKMASYILYLLLGAILGMSIFEPLGICSHTQSAAVGLAFAAVFELDSIKNHVCELHGWQFHFSVKRFLISLLKRKANDLGEAVEDATKDE